MNTEQSECLTHQSSFSFSISIPLILLSLEKCWFLKEWRCGKAGRVQQGISERGILWWFVPCYVTSVVSDSVILWTVAHQAPLSIGFSRQEYWSVLPCPRLGDLPDPGIEPAPLTSPASTGWFFTTSATWFVPWKWKWGRVRLFATPWTVAYQGPPSMEFSRKGYWSGLPFPSPGIFPTQGSNLGLPHCRQTLYHLSHQGSRKGGLKLWNREKCFSFLLSCSVFSRPSHLTAHLSVLSSWLKYALKITNWHNCIAFPPNWFSLSLYTPHTHTHIFFCFTPFSHFITQCSGLVKRHISHALVENVYVLIRNWRSLHWSPVSS